MAKTIALKQLAQKKYDDVKELSEVMRSSLGDIEDAFDCIIYGASGNGKSNFTIILLKDLIKALKCKCEYVAYEEAHAKTIRKMMIERHNMLEELGNVVQITDHYTYAELVKKMERRKSAKIWVIDSIQASRLTSEQCDDLKRKFVLSRKKKIIIYISWAEGKLPQGASAKSVEYYSHIKIRVDGLVAFFKSRYGGNRPFVIWEQGAIAAHGVKKINGFKKQL
jgi:hypothetical protein